MDLNTWVRKLGGTGKASKFLGVKRNNIYAWLVGAALPRPFIMQRVVKRSKGAVSYDEMIDEHRRLRENARKSGRKLKMRPKKKSKKTVH